MSGAGMLMGLLLTQAYYTPREAQEVFQQANDAYARQDYAAARRGFSQLVEHGYTGADLFYNLGTSCLAQGELGCAVLNLERARRADPDASDVTANLEQARARQKDQVVGAAADDTLVERVGRSISGGLAAGALLGFWTAAFALLIAVRFLRERWRTPARIAALVCGVAAAAWAGLLWIHVEGQAGRRSGVVMAGATDARESPSASAKVSFQIHAGLRVRLLEQAGNYVKVRLPNGLEGWAPRADVAEI